MPHAWSQTSLTEGQRGPRATEETHRTNPRQDSRAPRFTGGSISVPTIELVCVWSMLVDGHIRPLDVRTWIASREVAERRRFRSRGKEARYTANELARLVGGGGESQVRASLRRLSRVGLVSWSKSGPRFVDSPENLAVDDLSTVLEMQGLMPKRRRTFPLPRRMARLMAGGVKRSVLAGIFGHLLRCPRYARGEGWSGVGACKASWVASAFRISLRSAKDARAHLMHELGWLSREDSPQWHQNRYGGRFEVNLDWNAPGLADEQAAVDKSTRSEPALGAESAPLRAQIRTESAPPESKQPSLQGEIHPSTPAGAAPRPPIESSSKKGEDRLPAPNLSKLIRADLRSVSRVMELFTQATSSSNWRRRGLAPTDTYLERLNWAASARRALVRGGSNPEGLFIHLVTKRKWDHISNEDEDAVRRDLARWMNPEPQSSLDGGGGGSSAGSRARGNRPPALSADAKTLRFVEARLRNLRIQLSPQRVNREFSQRGWSAERIANARRDLEAWQAQGQRSSVGQGLSAGRAFA